MFKKLFIGNVSKSVSAEDLENLFNKFGSVSSCNVVKDKNFGFVEFSDPHDARAAMTELDGHLYHGLKLHIQVANSETGTPNDKRGDRRSNRDKEKEREVRDTRDYRDNDYDRKNFEDYSRRDNRDTRDSRDTRDNREVRDTRDNRERDTRGGRDTRDSRDENRRDNRDIRDTRDSNRINDYVDEYDRRGAQQNYNDYDYRKSSNNERPRDDYDEYSRRDGNRGEVRDTRGDNRDNRGRDTRDDNRDNRRDNRDNRDNRGGERRDNRDVRDTRDDNRDNRRDARDNRDVRDRHDIDHRKRSPERRDRDEPNKRNQDYDHLKSRSNEHDRHNDNHRNQREERRKSNSPHRDNHHSNNNKRKDNESSRRSNSREVERRRDDRQSSEEFRKKRKTESTSSQIEGLSKLYSGIVGNPFVGNLGDSFTVFSSEPHLESEEIEKLFRPLRDNPSFQRVRFHLKKNVFEPSMEHFSYLLRNDFISPSVTCLDFSLCEKIDGRGFKFVCETLRNASHIKFLDLSTFSSRSIDNESVRHLSKLISKNPSITSINLFNQHLDDEELSYLLDSVKSNSTLTSVLISNFGERSVPAAVKEIQAYLAFNFLTWSPLVHSQLPDSFKDSVLSFLLSLRHQQNKKKFSLPTFLLFEIIKRVDIKSFVFSRPSYDDYVF